MYGYYTVIISGQALRSIANDRSLFLLGLGYAYPANDPGSWRDRGSPNADCAFKVGLQTTSDGSFQLWGFRPDSPASSSGSTYISPSISRSSIPAHDDTEKKEWIIAGRAFVSLALRYLVDETFTPDFLGLYASDKTLLTSLSFSGSTGTKKTQVDGVGFNLLATVAHPIDTLQI